MEKQGVKTRDLVEMALFAAIIVILAFTEIQSHSTCQR